MPNDLRVRANGLVHRVLEWAPVASATPTGPRTLVLVHGFMDAGGTWDLVAPALASRGHRVLAPDMRGFGEGPRAPSGTYYHFADYVADLADLIAELAPGEKIGLVGHSMGGTIATLYAGTFPECVGKLANLEGLGPPDNPFEVGPIRMRRWIEEVRASGARVEEAPSFPREDALRRLVINHPKVAPEVLATRLPHLVRERDDGRVVWRYDPLHRTISPTPFFAKLFAEFAKKVTCPVLFVSGGEGGFHSPDEAERLIAFARSERREIADAGHMMHWTKPAELTEILAAFFDGSLDEARSG